MKYLLVLIFSALLITGCGKDENSAPADDKNKYSFDSSDIKTEPADNPGEEFQLVYNFNKGEDYTYRLTMISDVNQEAGSDSMIKMSSHSQMIYILNMTPRETDSDGNTELICKITSGKIEMDDNGRKVTYQSDSIKTQQDKEKYADQYSMINNEFSVRITKYGEILDIFKTDKIVNSFLQYKNAVDSATAEDKTYLKNQVAETMLKPLITQIFRKVPEKTMAKDSLWTIKQPKRQMLIFELDQTNNFRIKNLEKLNNEKIAVIDVDIDTKLTGDTKRTEQGVNYNISRPVITGNGIVYFNVDKGYIQKVKSETTVQLNTSMEANTPQGLQKRRSKENMRTLNFVERI